MSARALLLAAGAVGSVAILTQTSCLALLCYEDESCADGSGGSTTSSVTASQASTTLQATAVSASQSSGGGQGGGPPCDMSKLATDSENCGACGHDCLYGECSDGVCQPFSIDTDPSTSPMGPIAVFKDHVFMIVRGTTTDIKSVPIDFDLSTMPLILSLADDTEGRFGRGTQRLYYAPQSVAGRIYACNETPGCSGSTMDVQSHFVGSAAIGDTLYVSVSNANVIGSIELVDGVPATRTVETVIQTLQQPAGGVYEMFADTGGQIVFATYATGGCLYREDPSTFVLAQANCDGSIMVGGGISHLTSDPSGNAYIATAEPHLPLVGPILSPGTLSSIGSTLIRGPIAADESFIYARSATDAPDDGLLILDKRTGELVHKVGSDPPGSIDATDTDFVFFSLLGKPDQNRIYRLRKPIAPPP